MKRAAILCVFVGVVCGGSARADNEGFLPTWRLLNNEQKQQFISGYLFGWRDAARITKIAADYVRSNPDQGAASLEKIESLYDFKEVKPAVVVAAIDLFYSDPKNTGASLSMAMSAAQQAVTP